MSSNYKWDLKIDTNYKNGKVHQTRDQEVRRHVFPTFGSMDAIDTIVPVTERVNINSLQL